MATKLDPRLERLIDSIDVPKGVRSDADDLIRDAIASSPYLQNRLLEQLKDGELARIGIGHQKGAWGFFKQEEKTAYIDTSLFEDFKDKPKGLGDALTYVLGHEVGHSNISFERDRAKAALDKAMSEAYWNPDRDSSLVDITPQIRDYVRFTGTDETRSEIEGWNALVSRVETQKGTTPSKQELLDRAQPISGLVGQNEVGRNVALNGVKLEGDMYLRYFKPESEAVSQNAKAVSGVFYTPELQARYAAYAVGVAQGQSEHYRGPDPYDTGINFKQLHLTPKQLEAAGLHLGDKGTFVVTDISNGGRNWVTLKQTRPENSVEPHMPPDEQPTVPKLEQPGQTMFDQALLALNRSPSLKEGSLSEQEKKQVAMGLTIEALRATPPLSRIDHVVVGKGENPNFFAVQGDLRDPGHLRAHLPANEAVRTNIEQGADQLNQLSLQRTQEQQLAREPEQTQAQSNPASRMGGL